MMASIIIAMLIAWLARRPTGLWVLLVLPVLCLGPGVSAVFAADTPTVRIPADSVRYRLQLERAAGERFGIDAPVATLAGQLHQESGWNPLARSPYAQGLAQFTPPTAAWIPQICPGLDHPDPWDASWSIRAVACYDQWLFKRAPGATACDRWAMTLSAYNGGEAARDRERRMAHEARDDPVRWFGQVDRYRSRGSGAWQENRTYVRRILLTLEPAYLAAGWPGKVTCP
ncbi:transglycosylase SLT domain-containing protein [Luteibacter anthropi]|uniref:transglycosylase SLT domain-containing protein n=1 Tax=Luteibacter anthropi TaxID=564369 RepID=UPI002032FE4B|nr:transglycosylase SLT domain-containing protein [Luteibacter anthropi]URX63269.1 transglycosylase SLT domain-containing protein [Luteibacter anthropi]